jgi:cell division protein FtsL
MVRKFELHLDALIVIVLLFVAAVGFIVFQRHQYSLLAQENSDRQMKEVLLELEVARLEAQLKKAMNSAVPAGPRKDGPAARR